MNDRPLSLADLAQALEHLLAAHFPKHDHDAPEVNAARAVARNVLQAVWVEVEELRVLNHSAQQTIANMRDAMQEEIHHAQVILGTTLGGAR